MTSIFTTESICGLRTSFAHAAAALLCASCQHREETFAFSLVMFATQGTEFFEEQIQTFLSSFEKLSVTVAGARFEDVPDSDWMSRI